MIDPPPQLDAWLKFGGAIAAILVTVLVPLGGILKEYWSFRAKKIETESIKADTARAIPGPVLGDAIAIGQLAEALNNVAAAIRADTASDEQLAKEAGAKRVEQLTEQLTRVLENQPARRR